MASKTTRDGAWSVTRYDKPLGRDAICESHRLIPGDGSKVVLLGDGTIRALRACGPGWRSIGKYPTIAAARAAIR